MVGLRALMMLIVPSVKLGKRNSMKLFGSQFTVGRVSLMDFSISIGMLKTEYRAGLPISNSYHFYIALGRKSYILHIKHELKVKYGNG